MNLLLMLASLLAAATFLLHTILGGREIARPLLHSNLHPVPMLTHYYCWHLVTIMLFAMPICYALAAWQPERYAGLAWLMTLLAGAFALWSIALVFWKRQSWWAMPQWLLFCSIAAAGLVGLLDT